MSDKVYEIKKMCDSSGGAYVFISGGGEDSHNRFNSYQELMAAVASHSALYSTERVEVSVGRNIMDEDGPAATYKVEITIC